MRFHFDWEACEPLVIASRMKVPLLVIHDRDDRFVPHAEGASLAAAWPTAELITTSGLGHHWLLRDPRVIDRVADFVVPARASSGAGHEQRLRA